MKKILMLATVLSICVGCTSEKENKTEAEAFSVITPIIKDTIYTREYVADINSLQNVEIRSRVKGFIESIHIDEGKPVKAGQLLFSINNKSFKEDLARARALLKNARAESWTIELELKGVKTLAEKNVVSAVELEMAESKFAAAQAKVEEAKADEATAELNLSLAEIRAPFDGIVNRIPNKAGSLIDEGTLLTSISDNKEVFAYFYMSEKEYLDFKLKKDVEQQSEVELILANHTLYQHKGLIETAEGEIDRSTGNIAFRARFPNPDDLLKNGSNGKILLRKVLKNVILIPQKSTFDIQDKTYAFVLDYTDTVHMRAIIPLFRLQDMYILESGLSSTDRIIYEGVQHVKDGDRVKVKMVSANKSLVINDDK
jgi:RND family efflux transporter MFP subunit